MNISLASASCARLPFAAPSPLRCVSRCACRTACPEPLSPGRLVSDYRMGDRAFGTSMPMIAHHGLEIRPAVPILRSPSRDVADPLASLLVFQRYQDAPHRLASRRHGRSWRATGHPGGRPGQPTLEPGRGRLLLICAVESYKPLPDLPDVHYPPPAGGIVPVVYILSAVTISVLLLPFPRPSTHIRIRTRITCPHTRPRIPLSLWLLVRSVHDGQAVFSSNLPIYTGHPLECPP